MLTFCVPFVITVTPGEITRKGREEIQHRPRDQHVIINTGKSRHDYHCNSQTYNRMLPYYDRFLLDDFWGSFCSVYYNSVNACFFSEEIFREILYFYL